MESVTGPVLHLSGYRCPRWSRAHSVQLGGGRFIYSAPMEKRYARHGTALISQDAEATLKRAVRPLPEGEPKLPPSDLL
jgi:hypothetical protein